MKGNPVFLLLVAASFVHSSTAEEHARLDWGTLPSLPRAISGQAAGVSNGALLVAGGSLFSRSLFDTGVKQWVRTIYVLEAGATHWKEFDLGQPLGYSGSVTASDSLILVGGGDSKRNYNSAFALRWRNGQIERSELPPLPVATANLSAALLGNTIYAAGGQESPASTSAHRRFWSLDLSAIDQGWHELPPWPGAGCILPVLAAQDGEVYLAGGAALMPDAAGGTARRYLTNAFAYRPGKGWRTVADLPRPAVAAPSATLGQSHFLVLGGDDGEFASRIFELKDRHPGFRRDILAFHTTTGTWTALGQIPASQVTVPAVWFGGRIVIPGGEDRPGHRVATVLAASPSRGRAHIGGFDYTVLSVYLATIVGVGIWFTRRNRTTSDFFLAGRRIPWWAAGLSIYSAQLSSITFMAVPAKAFATDWTYVLVNACILIVAPVIVLYYMPFFHRSGLTTAYEYLELRFNRAVRVFASSLYILFQLGRLAIVLFLPAIALATVSDLNVYACILIMGILAIVYTVLGGIEAVIWTEVVQSVVLLGGAILCFVLAIKGTGGEFSEFLSLASADGKLRIFDWSWDLTTATVWVLVAGNLASVFATYTTDQGIIQKYLTTPNEKSAARSIWTNAWMTIPSTLLFFGLGTALYAYYKSNPAALNPHLSNDAILPWFIVQNLPAGIAGLVLAALFAAAQSTVSSGMHSMSTAFVVDFYRPFRPQSSDRQRMTIARAAILIFGATGTAVALLMATYEIQSLFDLFLGLLSLFSGGLAGIFALGIFTRRATAAGALAGGICSTLLVLLVRAHTPIHFFLYAVIGLSGCMVIGYGVSLLQTRARSGA